jgi:molybdenum cofactor synthesis domain-containing protein
MMTTVDPLPAATEWSKWRQAACEDLLMLRVGILTMSDTGASGSREDTSGAAVREIMEGSGATVARYALLPDEQPQISAMLRTWADSGDVNLILTTGGTGLSLRDVTPDATREVLDRETPGIAELMRVEGIRHTPMAALSRAIAGTRGRALIVNLPGSEKGVRESLAAILPVLPHAVDILNDAPSGH